MIYIPVNDPRNPENICKKFNNDVTYQYVIARPLMGGLRDSFLHMRNVINQNINEINCVNGGVTFILTIKNSEIINGPWPSHQGVYHVNIDVQYCRVPG